MCGKKSIKWLKALKLKAKTVKFFAQVVLLPVYLYRYTIKFFLPMSCRFEPTCSAYAIEAVHSLGPIKGVYKTLFRLLRCNQWCSGGYDPVIPLIQKDRKDKTLKKLK